MGYLVISRRTNERIMIGDDIEILISNIIDDRVDIAINAPKNISIKRKCTHLEEQKQNGDTTRNQSRQRHKRD